MHQLHSICHQKPLLIIRVNLLPCTYTYTQNKKHTHTHTSLKNPINIGPQ